MQIADDGEGFDPSHGEGRGMGLRTMRYRAGLIGASLTVAPVESGGTLVTCWIIEGAR
jgi:signal transduction histidine kinase